MASRILEHDWASTPLGAMATWPQSLRTAVDIMLGMPGPATILWGPAGTQLYNDAYITIAQERHPSLLGRPVAEGWPDIFEPVIAPLLAATAAGRATRLKNYAVTFPGADGGTKTRMFDTDWTPLRDETGSVAGALQTISAASDATDRRRAEAALRASEERFQTLARSIGDVFYITDLERGELEYLSPAYERVWQRPLAELMAHLDRFLDTIHPEDRANFEANKARQASGEALTTEYRIVRPDGSVRHILDRSFPVPGAENKRSAGIATDITDRKRAEAALRESEERLRTVLSGIPQLVWSAARPGEWTWASPQWTAFTGQRMEDSAGWGWLDMLHPDDRDVARTAWASAVENGALDVEYRIRRRANGRYCWFHTRATPIRDDRGQVVEWLGTSTDMDEIRQFQEALQESEERFRQFGEASLDLLWIRNAETLAFEYLSPAWERLYGVPREEVPESNPVEFWLELIHPDDRKLAKEALQSLRKGVPGSLEFRAIRPNGEVRWIHNTDFPLFDQAAKVHRIAGIAQDVTDRRRAIELQGTLVAELQHRVRNLLSLIRSVIRRTSTNKTDLEEFVQHLQGRIDAMARTQALLTRAPGKGVDLEDIIRDEMLAQSAGDEKFSVEGPPVQLSPHAAEILTLAVHELATNSVKYGALGGSEGRITVSWACQGERSRQHLELRWHETGPASEGSREPGFGTELIEKRVPYELKGRGELRFGDGDLTATIAFPIEHGSSILETEPPTKRGMA